MTDDFEHFAVAEGVSRVLIGWNVNAFFDFILGQHTSVTTLRFNFGVSWKL